MSLPSGKCSMEVSRLIAEVHRRPELWDRQHPQHHNRSVLDRHWESVANLLGITGKAARGKWKNLKDHFRKEYKRCVASANSDQEMSRWPYFYSMMFIREQISHPVTVFLTDPQYQNVCPKTETTNVREEGRRGGGVGGGWVSAGPEDGYSPAPEDDDDDDDGYRPLNCLHVEYGNWSADDRQQDENNFSDDKHFLLSLLPMFSTLTPDKKLKARIAIETSLLNIAYPDLTVQDDGGGSGTTTDPSRPCPLRVVEQDCTSQKTFDPTTPSTKTTTSDSILNTTPTTTITPVPSNSSTSTLTATAVVTATATCTPIETENKKRNSENDRLQLPKKVCTANSRKC